MTPTGPYRVYFHPMRQDGKLVDVVFLAKLADLDLQYLPEQHELARLLGMKVPDLDRRLDVAEAAGWAQGPTVIPSNWYGDVPRWIRNDTGLDPARHLIALAWIEWLCRKKDDSSPFVNGIATFLHVSKQTMYKWVSELQEAKALWIGYLDTQHPREFVITRSPAHWDELEAASVDAEGKDEYLAAVRRSRRALVDA